MDNKTIITTEDVKNIADSILKGESNGFNITIKSEDTGETKEINIIDYLNFELFNFRKRLENTDTRYFPNGDQYLLDSWVDSMELVRDKLYGLVDIIDIESSPSKDIDNASVAAKITFLCPIEKVTTLEHYLAILRNKYIGNPQYITNSFGNGVSVYILIGILNVYEDTIGDTALGERVKCELGLNLNYIANAITNKDYYIKLLPNAYFNDNGDCVQLIDGVETPAELLTLPITKQTHQLIATTIPVPKAYAPETTGNFATALSRAITLNYYIYNDQELSTKLETLFWGAGAINTKTDPNIRVALQVFPYLHEGDGIKLFKYNCILKEMENVITDGQFTIGSMSLITSAK